MVVPPNISNDFVPKLLGTETREKRKEVLEKKSKSQISKKFEVPHAGAWF